jgi:heme-degrading monooxygenase HmoA
MLLKSRGLKGVARYQVKDDSSRAPRYLAVYRFPSQKDFEAFEQSPETAAAIKEMQVTWGNKVQLVSRTKCELIREW